MDVVNGKKLCPKEPSLKIFSEDKKTIESKRKLFYKNDALAQLLLVGSVDSDNVEFTATCNTAKAVWEKLTSMYE